ncbi:MAG TPA: CBS domain-containing protein [Candidatus Merdenecus merdavium]|nr:CBS domain-containing protein [Candidatus Merdenecus merdavium]
MNILFFLTPKSEVAYINDTFTLRETIEKMEYHRYTAIPMINKAGEYIGTITEGDLLWSIKNKYSLNLYEAENVKITDIPRRMDNEPVNVNCNIEDLIMTSMRQNFVPVIDDDDIFIGIIKRKDIIEYCFNKLKKQNKGEGQ